MERKNLKLAVKNFGPIREGEVEFKLLTVFIGPNNSGKSYMATLLYALLQGMTGRREFPFMSKIMHLDFSSEEADELNEWAQKLSTGSITTAKSAFSRIHTILQGHYEDRLKKVEVGVGDSLRDYFGCEELRELVRRNSTGYSARLFREGSTTPIVRIGVENEDMNIEINVGHDSYTLADSEILLRSISAEDTYYAPTYYSYLLWTQLQDMLASVGVPSGGIYYLPAGRSGLLQGWQTIASLAIGMLGPRIGTQDFEIPSFPGTARDFTQKVLGLVPPGTGSGRRSDIVHAIELMEYGALRGTIDIQTGNNVPMMRYKSGELYVPLNRVSSMISELAPIHLWMNHILKNGDVLIIDEPEAHLHPENQRLIAQVLVRLMNAGVRVVCTTHSSLILHQLSNQILATSSGKLNDVGFTEHDQLGLDDIGVYLFEPSEEGVYVKEVEVDSDFGISEDEFVRVADSIGEETYQLVT